MLSETKMLLQRGVAEKRKGNFSGAIALYKKAIKIEPDNNSPILYISLAKSQYLADDMDECVENYMRALYYQISEISHLIDINKLSDTYYQISLLNQFSNTLKHLAYAHVKQLDYTTVMDFYQLLEERGYTPSYHDVYSIIDYLSDNYAYELASGGIDYPPDEPLAIFDYQGVNWDELFVIKGLQIAHRTINWHGISMLVIANKGLTP